MKLRSLFFLLPVILVAQLVCGQSLHFSQYYNAPLLLNPANTALMPENDYRLGASFRSQWASLPVPYSTTSAYGDFQVMRNQNETNWLGLGFAFFNDKAGDGKLGLFRSEALVAYHVQVGSYNMISVGGSASYGQRSVNFSKMSYPVQWDGYEFNKDNPNQENKGLEKSSYASVAAGLNYAFFPNEFLYIKLGVGVANLNQPSETFWGGGTNRLEYRPSANLDIMMKSNEKVILNPSAYYSTQSGAREIMYGTLILFNTSKPQEQIAANQLIFGAFHRWGDAVVGVAGIQRNGFRIMASYDYTISTLPAYANGATGAMELSIRYEGLYGDNSRGRRTYHCPRF